MSAEHTPGKVIHDTRGYPNPDVRPESGRKIAVTWMVGAQPKTHEAYIKRVEQDRANARRIVACWNACDGVETELLEQHPAPFSELRAERDRLHAANVELLEAIEELTHSLDRDELLHDDQRSAFDKARAAIAKHGSQS